MKILITGGTGLVGSALAKKLLQKKHEITLVTRSKKKLIDRLDFPCGVLEWDTKSDFPVEELVRFDAVIHLAGESIAAKLWTKKQKKRIYDSRVVSTTKLSEALKALGDKAPPTFVCASAVGFYSFDSEEPLTEESSAGEGFLSEVCVAWEAACHAEELANTRVANVRIGIVLAKEGGFLAKLKPLFQAFLGGRLGSGKQHMSVIHLDDLVDCLVFCLENPIAGPVNAVCPEPVTNKEFTKEFAAALGTIVSLPVPSWALKTALGDMSNLMLGNQRVIPTVLQKNGFSFRFPNLKAALADIYPKK